MSPLRKFLLGAAAVYVIASGVVLAIFGFTRRDNQQFQPQNEFELEPWIDIPGPLDFNRAVLYLLLAAALTIGTMIWIARRMQARPNRVPTAVEDRKSVVSGKRVDRGG